MATGYQTRPAGQTTFAQAPVKPGASGPTASGQSRGAQIVGGQSEGGAVLSGPQTNPGPMASGLGQYFEQLMRPHVEKRMREQFFKGVTDAQSGIALKDVDKPNSAMSQIFGSTSYQEGAQFYKARTQLDKWTQDRYAEIDTLKKMPPEELSKVLATTSQGLMTGNAGADALIQGGLLEAYAPLGQAVAKARYGWQQNEAANAMADAAMEAGGALNSALVTWTGLATPTDTDNAVPVAANKKFLSSLVKPEGMSDETYKGTMFTTYMRYMSSGNFYAVKSLKDAGIDNIFDDDQKLKLDDAYHKYADKKMGDAVMDYLLPDLAKLDDGMAKGSITPLDAQKELVRMNNVIKLRTGVTEDLFDWKAINGQTKDLMGTIMANYRRAQERGWQIEDRNYTADAKAREVQAGVAATQTAWGIGDVNGAITTGLPQASFDTIALNEYRSNKFDGLGRAFVKGKWTSSAVANEVQAGVEASLGEQYGKNFERTHQQWVAMNKTNGGMTASYYGKWNEPMRTFDTLQRTLGPETAFTRAFGDPSRYSSASLDPDQRKAADTAIDTAIASRNSSGWNPFGSANLNASATRALKGLVTERVAMAMKNSDGNPVTYSREQMDAVIADGSFQVAGEFGWRAAKGTKPFDKQLQVQPGEAGTIFKAVTGEWLRKAGFKYTDQADTDYDIDYVNIPGKGLGLNIVARSADGSDRRRVVVPMSAYKLGRDQILARTPKPTMDFPALQFGTGIP